jgi:multicomponent Na+:H+ antiporter subunit G
VLGQALALFGAVLTLLAAIGVVRFPDVLSRMHALTKASTLGFVLVAVGAALELPTANDATSALLAAGLQILGLPVAANLIARTTYLAEGIPHRVDTVDELAETLDELDVVSPPPASPEAGGTPGTGPGEGAR